MNILFLNTTYICGGAEKVANQIMNGMRMRGHQVYEIVSYHKRPEALPEGITALYQGTPMLIFNRLITGNHSNASLTIPYSLHAILRFIKKKRIDVVHLHNAHGNFLGIYDIQKISEFCPIVWTLHDFWALTGHCTYPTSCPDSWKSGCPTCSQLNNYPPLRKDIAAKLLNAKKEAFHTSKIHYTVPSFWMMRQFMQSHLSDQNCICIPNSLDTSLWIPYPKKELRQKYQIPSSKRILAFVAADPSKKLKGMHLLLEALQQLPDPEQYLLLIAGQKNGLDTLEHSRFSIRHFGYLTNQKQMNEFYSLADIVVNPSLYETFGLVNIEAMASGTPVIAFSVCAMDEIIAGSTGWCISDINSESLSQTILSAFSDASLLRKKGIAARAHVRKLFSEEKMLDSFEFIYKNAVAK